MLRTGALILALLLLAQPWSGAASDKTVLMELDLRSSAQPLGVSSGGEGQGDETERKRGGGDRHGRSHTAQIEHLFPPRLRFEANISRPGSADDHLSGTSPALISRLVRISDHGCGFVAVVGGDRESAVR